MPAVKGVSLQHPGNSLATWLASNHPDIFLALYQKARQANTAKQIKRNGLKGLGQDETSFDSGTTTTFDTADVSSPDPPLQTFSIDFNAPPSTLLTDSTADGSSFLSSVGSSSTASGSTLGSVLGSVGSGILSAIGSVGSYLASPTGLNAASGVAKAVYGAQAASAAAQTIQTQIARTAANQTAAPITYAQNAAGQLVPVYATQTPQGAVYQPLTSQGLQSLTPSGLTQFLSQYGLWVLGAGVAVLALMARRSP